LPFKNGEVKNIRRAATIEVFAQRGGPENDINSIKKGLLIHNGGGKPDRKDF